MPGLDMMQKLLIGFITLIVGIMLVGTLAVQGNLVGDKLVITDEVVSVATAKLGSTDSLNVSVDLGPITNVPTTWKITDCPLTSITVTNATGTALTVTTDYTLSTTTGVLNVLNTTATVAAFTGSNNSLIDYTYCGDDYLNLSWGRMGIDTAVGLFALGLFLISVGLFYSVYKDLNIA